MNNYLDNIVVGGVERVWDGCQWLKVVTDGESSWVGSKPYCDGCSQTGTCACGEHTLVVDPNRGF